MTNLNISGNIVDVLKKTIYPGTVCVKKGRIDSIIGEEGKRYDRYILPGFIDAHVHIESSMLPPSEFARLATVNGTVASVSDPHEIANVMGIAGIRFMLEDARKTPFEIAFGAPSCVPATCFETAGTELSAKEIYQLFFENKITYLSEVMNVPGVLAREKQIMHKIGIARQLGLPVDGHCPGLYGSEAKCYASAGITTDHECCSLTEALDKIAAGMKIIIREGSAAKNYDALHPLIDSHCDRCMFCSDDKHPDDLVKGQIDDLVRRSVALGYDLMKVLQIACINPVLHYHLNVGLLRVGDPADFIAVNNLHDFEIRRTYCKGILVACDGKPMLPSAAIEPINNFATSFKKIEDFSLKSNDASTLRVICALDGQLITKEKIIQAPVKNGEIVSDLEQDILKIAVVNRYADALPAVALIHNFGLKRGAIASSVAHDSHNIVAVGTSDREICAVVNAVIQNQGGISLSQGNLLSILPLPLAGLMSQQEGYKVARAYSRLDSLAKQLGSTLSAPFMTLSFMALLVIPELKLSDLGLFSSKDFQFVPLQVD